MAQLPLPDYIATFLSRRACKALVIVSPSFVPQNPLSLQEQLLVMTRRSNVMTRRTIEAEEVNEMYEMSEGNLQVRYDELAQRHQQVLAVVSRADYMRVTGLDRLFGN
jgi:chemotaxis regulatin CheY-phosphate phosphatase CheZ